MPRVRTGLLPGGCLLASLCLVPGLHGQTTGSLVGSVAEAGTGAPLQGVSILVERTNLGAVSGPDGHYFLNGVPVGAHRMTAVHAGHTTRTRELRILAGQTHTLDFALDPEAIAVDPLVATIELEPLIVRDEVRSKTRFVGREIRDLPVDDVDDVITLSAGVYEGQGGFIVRGGRGTEAATYVDGVLVSDFTTQLTTLGLSQFAVEEIDVVTGGFQAEFGNAQSGLINVVTRSGGADFGGQVRFSTDGRWGTDGYDPDELAAFDAEPCCGYRQLQASLGGPLWPGGLATFFASVELTGAADDAPRAGGFNPALGRLNSSGSTDAILPGARGQHARWQARVSAFPGSARLGGTLLFSRDQQELHAPALSVKQFLTTATRSDAFDAIVGWDQRLYRSPTRQVDLQVRAHFHRSETRSGVPRSPAAAAELERLLGAGCGAECDVTADAFEPEFLGFLLGPVEFFFEDSLPRTVHGLVVPHPEDPDPVFGITNVWADRGFPLETDRRTERRGSIRADVEGQLTRSLRLKSGVEWTWMDLAARSGALAENGSLEFWDVDPRVGAAYVQGRVDVGDLVFDLGLRWDHWNPHTTFPLFPGHVDCSISPVPRRLMDCFEGMPVARAPTRNELAPRLGVAFPVTDRSQMRLSFGRFHQLPQLRHFFGNHRSHLNVAVGGFGNPLLEHVETTALEVGLTRVLGEDLALEVVAYHRDRRGAIRLDLFPPERIAPTVREVRTFVNADNGNVKGVDLTLRRRLAAYWAFDLAWSLQWARGTTSSPTAFIDKGFGLLFDPRFPERRLEPPTELFPEDFDRLHTFNGRIELRLPPGWWDGTTLGSLFEDTSLYAVYTAHSGEPYTRTAADRTGTPIEDFNASRLPWSHRGDLRVAKGFELASGIGLDVFALVRNFLDGRDAIAVHPVTGRTDREGLEDQLKLNPFISPRFRTNGTAGNDFPLALDDIAAEHRAAFGRQDRDGDGVITREEAIASLGDALVAQSDLVFHYGEPRQLRFGVEVRF